MDAKNMTALLLAGNPKCLKQVPGQSTTYLDTAVMAVGSLGVKEVIVVGDAVPESAYYTRIPSGQTACDSLLAGLEHAQGDYVLIVATDLPYLGSKALHEFLTQVGTPRAAVYFSFASLAECGKYGHTSKHGVSLEGERVKLGSVFLVQAHVLLYVTGRVRYLLQQRKHPILIVLNVLGLLATLRFLLSLLIPAWGFTRSEVEEIIQNETGIRCRGLRCSAELAVDHDNVKDAL